MSDADSAGARALRIIAELAPLARTMCAPGYDLAIERLQRELPLIIRESAQADEHNGWRIPPSWEVLEATIRRGGTLVYDGATHPLGVISLSAPFEGSVELDELRRHLHFDHRFPHALTYHFRQNFRSDRRDWGFCVPRGLYEALVPGRYEVRIRTREAPGVLRVAECVQPGRAPYEIALCANLDHPALANDGIAGVAVGVEVMRQLAGRRTKLGYRLVLAPGIIGSEYYLGRFLVDERSRILECLCLWMLGSDTPLALQASRDAKSNIEHALARALQATGVPFRRGDFETIIINDEYLWEAWGIPACSLSRFPYPQYHSSDDDVSIMHAERLEEAVHAVLGAIDALESTLLVEKRFSGTPCLSHPRFGLYVDPGQVAIGDVPDAHRRSLRRLQDFIPALSRPTTTWALAERFELPEPAVVDYLREWERKDLLTLW